VIIRRPQLEWQPNCQPVPSENGTQTTQLYLLTFS